MCRDNLRKSGGNKWLCDFLSRLEKEAWIKAKYVEKKFITEFPEAGARLNRSGFGRGLEKPLKPVLKPKPPRLMREGAGMERITLSFPGEG